MTTVNTFDDILDILDQNPEYQEALRRRVLDEEHRRLPERIDRAVEAVEDLAQTVAEFVQRTNETLANHEARLERVEGQIADLNDVTRRVLETVADIQNRLANVEAKGDTMRGDMGDIRSEIRTMRGQLNNLNGTDYERRIVRRSRGIVERQLGIRQAQLLQAVTVPDNTTVPNLLRNAVESGVISGEQEEDVDDADLILFGNTSDGLDSYVVAEVSITIDDHDVDRAYRRAAVLRAASGVPVKAAVIGAQISEANRERAESLNVGVVIAAQRARG